MTLSVLQTATAVAPFITASFQGSGGTEPYLYSVDAGGAGGSIDPTSGIYTAPDAVHEEAAKLFDTITVTDYANETATARILVGTPLHLLCEIIQRQLGLDDGRVYLWDQKIFEPKDSALFVVVSQVSAKPFGNVNTVSATDDGMEQGQSLNIRAMIDVDAKSRSTQALLRWPEIVMALKSVYSLQQQDANSFYIASVPINAVNLSTADGAAIPYRYKISVAMQYTQPKVIPAPYFDDFGEASVVTDA